MYSAKLKEKKKEILILKYPLNELDLKNMSCQKSILVLLKRWHKHKVFYDLTIVLI